MPLTHISMRAGKPEAYRQAIFASLYKAMRETFNVPEDVFINLVEVTKENWSFGNGVGQYA